jgi:hypothetical protein
MAIVVIYVIGSIIKTYLALKIAYLTYNDKVTDTKKDPFYKRFFTRKKERLDDTDKLG